IGAPGVLAVITAADIDGVFEPQRTSNPRVPEVMGRPLLATDTVRFVGELVAAVVAETAAQAIDAAELVVVDYDALDAVADVAAALLDAAPRLFDGTESNVALAAPFRGGDDFFAGCDVVVRQRLVNQRMAVTPMEPRAGAMWWEDDGRLHAWSST